MSRLSKRIFNHCSKRNNIGLSNLIWFLHAIKYATFWSGKFYQPLPRKTWVTHSVRLALRNKFSNYVRRIILLTCISCEFIVVCIGKTKLSDIKLKFHSECSFTFSFVRTIHSNLSRLPIIHYTLFSHMLLPFPSHALWCLKNLRLLVCLIPAMRYICICLNV